MTYFAQLRHRVGWSAPFLADRLRASVRTIRRWDSGKYDAPDAVLAYLVRVADLMDGVPVPPPPSRLERS